MNDELQQFLNERNEALLSLDEAKIRAYMDKWSGPDYPLNKASPEVFWRAVHKAITGCISLPLEFRMKSKAWLDERGSNSMDDGELQP